ncbi:MAG TPA: hypothetical protein VFI54_01770 [Solirubrobacteraceae bacterium]|nr:hypothetical protein [Solirubrobacteraceae bacterium]
MRSVAGCCHVTDVLGAHRPQLDALTQALLEAETLDGIDAYRAAGLPMELSDQAYVIEPQASQPAGLDRREARDVPPRDRRWSTA